MAQMRKTAPLVKEAFSVMGYVTNMLLLVMAKLTAEIKQMKTVAAAIAITTYVAEIIQIRDFAIPRILSRIMK